MVLGLFGTLVTLVLVASSASAVGPYPDLAPCQVFPRPAGLALAADAVARAPRRPGTRTSPRRRGDPRSSAYIAYIDAHGGDSLHPDFGSPRAYGFPYSVVGADQRKLPVHYTAYGDESDPGPFPVPPTPRSRAATHSDGDRHVLVVDRAACRLYELYRAFFVAKPRPHWNADSGAVWDLRSAARRPDGWTSADAAGLPIFPGLVRYDEAAAGPHRPRDPGHRREHPQRLGPPRLATAPATPRPATRRRWACACGSRPATGSAASAARRGRSRWR